MECECSSCCERCHTSNITLPQQHSLVLGVPAVLCQDHKMCVCVCSVSLFNPVIEPNLWGHSGPLCPLSHVVVVVVVVDIDAQAACDSGGVQQ